VTTVIFSDEGAIPVDALGLNAVQLALLRQLVDVRIDRDCCAPREVVDKMDWALWSAWVRQTPPPDGRATQ
jgi:hypothetical protein